MPVHYDLDPSTSVVRARAIGDVRARDLIDHFDLLQADERLPKRLNLLLDLRPTTSLPPVEEIDVVLRKVDRLKHDRGVRGGACAIVAGDALRSTALLIETYVADHFARTEVFSELREAEDWIVSHR